MESCLKELAKLEKLTAKSAKGKSTSVDDSLNSLLQSLYEAKARMEAEGVSEEAAEQLSQMVEARKKEVDDRQKELYNSLSRLGKALDKVSHVVHDVDDK
jgi:phage-related minor tail protein